MAEQSSNALDALQSLINARLIDVNTALPASIVSYSNGLARVVPKPKKRFADGDVLDYPIIPNVRVCWPSFSGGTAGIKGPVKPGDNCLLVFSQQAVDDSDDRRMFDLQDAYAIMCDLGSAGQGDSGNNNDMTMFFGAAFIRLTQDGALNIYAPGGTKIDTPDFENTGNQLNRGYLTGQTGLAITGIHPATGFGSKVTGEFRVESGDVIADTISLKTHRHSGVQTGAGNTGLPVA